MKTWFGQGVILFLTSVLFVACAPTPVVPSGKSRIPVNSEEGISQYRERVKVDQRDRVERNGLTRQVEALTKQIQELKSYVTLLQLQQQESEKGRGRQVKPVGAGSPPLLSRAPDKGQANKKELPGAPTASPIAAVRREVAVLPMIAIEEASIDPCGQRLFGASPYGWIDLTSDYPIGTEAHRAAHGPWRSFVLRCQSS